MPLPPVNDLTCIVTGSTNGIGREIARQLAQAGAHVVMAVRNIEAAQKLIHKWQIDSERVGIALNVEVMFRNVLHKGVPAKAGISVLCVSPGIVCSRSTLFAATDPSVSEYCELLKADEWPVCAFISQDCWPTNPSEEAYKIQTQYEVWEKTLEMIGLPSDAVVRLIEGEEVKCRYGQEQ